MALTGQYSSDPIEFIGGMSDFTKKHGRAPLVCKYCGESELKGAIIYKVTSVCLDCALARGSDK